eukprot:gnl/MRDRNA2_/MRDRNA2_309284_c0_seq1.p2 gnl/MRDRNA2_/MRDRNA2_309284_c0~~gnl/MRDRNA2_/MRDRNA2_309284_c0_seq1.p2  ORF type:complete len:102 (-),score=8.00 gnl/MRDRNA2_/MRDRNA2_309284_c0_seq1:277-582(-)
MGPEKNNQYCSSDVSTFAAVISACGKFTHCGIALELLREMGQRRVVTKPDTVCGNATLDACARARLWTEAIQLFERMCTSRSKVDGISIGVTLRALEGSDH